MRIASACKDTPLRQVDIFPVLRQRRGWSRSKVRSVFGVGVHSAHQCGGRPGTIGPPPCSWSAPSSSRLSSWRENRRENGRPLHSRSCTAATVYAGEAEFSTYVVGSEESPSRSRPSGTESSASTFPRDLSLRRDDTQGRAGLPAG